MKKSLHNLAGGHELETVRETVLMVDDDPAIIGLLTAALEPAGYLLLAASNGASALEVAQLEKPNLILLDVRMKGMDGFKTCQQLKLQESTSDIPVIFITSNSAIEDVAQGFSVGGVDYVTKPFLPREVAVRVENHLRISRLNRELRETLRNFEEENKKRIQAEESLHRLDEQLSLMTAQEAERWGVSGFIGSGPAFQKVLEQVRRIQRFASTSVLVNGESGTGKELVARAIHYGGARAKGPFIAVNCSAIPAEMAESLFFGHTKGSFTGASSDCKGFFEQADAGTLFLDEIGDMALPLQAKLLRALETGIISPLGGSQERKVDVRLVAATNADLKSHLETRRFREDLFYRLTRFTIDLPPLRDRLEDLPLLTGHFLKKLSEEMGLPSPRLAPAAQQALSQHDYPGNIRELKNILERALIECDGQLIQESHLHFLRKQPAPNSSNPVDPSRLGKTFTALNESDETRIVNYLGQRSTINNTGCRELLAVGVQRACYLLRKLHRKGILKRSSMGRWAEYELEKS